VNDVIPLACYRRKRFRTAREAESVVFRLRAKGTEQIEHFKCDGCGQWHLHRTDRAGNE
jgi:hypothetical protein